MNEKVPCKECGKPVSAEHAGRSAGLCIVCSVKLEEEIACADCGKPVPVKLAAKRNGLCLRCSAKRNPFFVLYSSLIDRVCHSPGGFESLSDAEKLYYSLTLFRNEVNNGGFHQFFYNSSGSYYELIESALVSFDETQTLELLLHAKQIVFPEISVPVDTQTRRKLLPEPAPDLLKKLDELDQRFYRSPDALTPKLAAFARQHGLIPADAQAKKAQS